MRKPSRIFLSTAELNTANRHRYNLYRRLYQLFLWRKHKHPNSFSRALFAPLSYWNQKMSAFKRFLPLFDRVLVERLLPELRTKGGIMIPEKAQGKVVQATVVACGPGARTETGTVLPVSVNVGDMVMLPEYGGTKVELEKKEYYLFRDSDILGKYES